MGKRSSFERRAKDYYPTPYKAILPLLAHIEHVTRYEEPCAGAGDLIDHFKRHGKICMSASDIDPQRATIKTGDATVQLSCAGQAFITNPPWERQTLHRIIERLSAIAPTYLLFDADWMHTRQAQPYLDYCQMIVSVGRLKWIPNSPHTGKDNCAWYKFYRPTQCHTHFIGRSEWNRPQI